MERLRVDYPILNRPFIYNRENLQNSLVRDGLNIRSNLIKRFKDLKPDLNRILDKSGKIIQLLEVNTAENSAETPHADQPIQSSYSLKSYNLQEVTSERGHSRMS